MNDILESTISAFISEWDRREISLFAEPCDENTERLRKNMHSFTDNEIYTKCQKIAMRCIASGITDRYTQLNVFNDIIEHELMYDKFSDEIAAKTAALAKPVNAENYRFLDKMIKTYDPVLIGLSGSLAHGTNTETSDIDIRGVAMLSPEQILLGKDFEQITDDTTDTTIYSFPKFIKLLTHCHPNTIEILGLKPEHYLYKSEIGEELLKRKEMFLSNRCINSFAGYAEHKLNQLRQTTTSAITEEKFNEYIASVVNDNLRPLKKDIEATVKDGKIVLNISAEDCPVEDLSTALDIINKTLADHRKLSACNRKALGHGKIAKHSMHLLRLYMMAENLLINGKVITHREKEHDLLMSIRNGEYLDEEGKPNREFFDIVEYYKARFNKAKLHSVLPDYPDIKQISDFIAQVHSRIIQNRIQTAYSGH